MKVVAVFAIMVALMPSLVMAQAKGKVTKLLRDPMSTYDEHGVFQAKIERWPLAKGGALIIGHNMAGQVGIDRNGQKVFLRNSEILTDGDEPVCLVVSDAARPAGQRIAASPGIGSGMSGTSSPCIPPQ